MATAIRVENLDGLLTTIERRIDGGEPRLVAGPREQAADAETGPTTTIGDILNEIGNRSFGPVLLLLGLVSISPATIIPGATWLLAAATLVIAVQLALGKKRPYLPRKLLKIRLPEALLQKFINSARPTAAFIDKFIRPRLTFLSRPPWVNLMGVLCILAALITFPAGLVPFAPILPGTAICLIGLGITARDGVFLTLSAVPITAAIWLFFTELLPALIKVFGQI